MRDLLIGDRVPRGALVAKQRLGPSPQPLVGRVERVIDDDRPAGEGGHAAQKVDLFVEREMHQHARAQHTVEARRRMHQFARVGYLRGEALSVALQPVAGDLEHLRRNVHPVYAETGIEQGFGEAPRSARNVGDRRTGREQAGEDRTKQVALAVVEDAARKARETFRVISAGDPRVLVMGVRVPTRRLLVLDAHPRSSP